MSGRHTLLRWLTLATLCIAGLVAMAMPTLRERSTLPPQFTFITTARQFGPVGYRDPVGALSPDGRWIAYSEGRFVRIAPIDGGAAVEFEPGVAQVRHLAWMADSRRVVANGFASASSWGVYDRTTGRAAALWAGREQVSGDGGASAGISALRQLSFSPDGTSVAAVVSGRDGNELWTIAADGTSARAARMPHAIAWPAWTPKNEVACITTADGRSRVTVPCGGPAVRLEPDADVYGPIAFSPDGRSLFLALANDRGTVDLWSAPAAGGRGRKLTTFSRDSYAPSVSSDGAVVFKVQTYRTHVALVDASGGVTRPLATFQSETPSWDPTGRRLGITYGTWRRVPDDAHYPDIAQDAGIIDVDPERPAERIGDVVHASASEDQSLCWSPNRKWIAFHSHKDGSDDVWLRPATGSEAPRRISFLGRGAETGWPRWSPDGRWIVFEGNSPTTHRMAFHVVGVDQESGRTTQEARDVPVEGLEGEVTHAEWLPDSASFAALGRNGPGRHVIFTLPRDGGTARIVTRFSSEHDASGLAVSPDGRDVAFVAPAPDGFFQVFRQPLQGGAPVQVTRDRSDKTQPAWSPDGGRLALTVWRYDVQFWAVR